MGHYTSFDDFETLVEESVEFRLLLRDSLLIMHDDKPLNRYVNVTNAGLFEGSFF